jgi:hypothetical protein
MLVSVNRRANAPMIDLAARTFVPLQLAQTPKRSVDHSELPHLTQRAMNDLISGQEIAFHRCEPDDANAHRATKVSQQIAASSVIADAHPAIRRDESVGEAGPESGAAPPRATEPPD